MSILLRPPTLNGDGHVSIGVAGLVTGYTQVVLRETAGQGGGEEGNYVRTKRLYLPYKVWTVAGVNFFLREQIMDNPFSFVALRYILARCWRRL